MICIAGKNEIAIYGLKQLLDLGVDKNKIIALTNKTDNGIDSWQPSFKKYCQNEFIKILDLSDVYDIENLIFISLEFDRIIPVRNFKSNKLFNIHFSLLPAYKGMFTSILPIINGEKYSGVTLHKIDEGIDTGDIIAQIKFEIPFGTTGFELYKLYLQNSKIILSENLKYLLSNKFKSLPQSIMGSTYYSKKTINFKKLEIDFNKTCFEVCNYVNAFSFRPYQLLEFKGIKIAKSIATEKKSTSKPGLILEENDNSFLISTIDYDIVLLKDNLKVILNFAMTNDWQSIQVLKDIGYDLDEKNEKGWDALIVACYHGSIDVVKYLIDGNHADINTINNNGTSAAMYAMTYASNTNNLDILELLIKKGVNMKHKDYSDHDIFYYANKYGNKMVISALSNYYEN